jgi:hypothetical protein
MGAKKTLVIWMTSLCTIFGGAASGTAQTGKLKFDDAMAVTVTTPEEKRVDFKPGVEAELRATAKAMFFKLVGHLQLGLAYQIMGMEDVLYYGLPVPVWNRIITALNDDGKRAKIVQALKDVVNGALSDDAKQVKKCKASINGWQADPLSFAKFLGDATGEDFINAPQTQQFQNKPQQK